MTQQIYFLYGKISQVFSQRSLSQLSFMFVDPSIIDIAYIRLLVASLHLRPRTLCAFNQSYSLYAEGMLGKRTCLFKLFCAGLNRSFMQSLL